MRPARAAPLALAGAVAAVWLAGPAMGQSVATDPGADGAGVAQPLNALKPMPQVPSVGAGTAAGTAADPAAGQGDAIQMQPLNALKPPSAPAPDGTTSGPAPGAAQGADTGVPSDNGGFVQDPSATGGAVAPTAVPGQTTTTTTTEKVADAKGGVVRWLDKVSGKVVDMDLSKGQSETEGRLTVTLEDCRYPVGDPASDAFAFLTIKDKLVAKPIFKGWMIASSPALNPLDSARYDVWVLRCTTS